MNQFDEELEEFAYAEYLEDNYPDLDPEEAEYIDYMLATGEGHIGDSSGCLLLLFSLCGGIASLCLCYIL